MSAPAVTSRPSVSRSHETFPADFSLWFIPTDEGMKDRLPERAAPHGRIAYLGL
jgi:hypothetical protein